MVLKVNLFAYYSMIRTITVTEKSVKKLNCIAGLGLYDKDKQIEKINQLYLNEEFIGSKEIAKCIKRKLSSYKTQDTRKDRYNAKEFITYESTLEKLVISRLICSYCQNRILLMHKDRREKQQWTLDRIDNSLCHSGPNTVVCCLECNLQKRCRDETKFRFSKQLRLIKEK